MEKMKRLLTILLLITISITIKSQIDTIKSNKRNIYFKVGGGAAIYTWGIEGFSIINEVNIPIFKSIEIAPSFTYVSVTPTGSTNVGYYYLKDNGMLFSNGFNYKSNLGSRYYVDYSLLSIDLNVFFRPLDFKVRSSKYIIKIGGGFGFKHYLRSRLESDMSNPIRQEQLIGVESVNRFAFNLGLQYNYLIKPNWLIGADLMQVSLNNDPGEGAFVFRLFFGRKL